MSYQQHIKSEIPKLRGKGLSAQQAMSAAAKSWREKKQAGGARQSRRVVNQDLVAEPPSSALTFQTKHVLRARIRGR
eukprot:COSAG01_NODE_5483_length_4230_cov_17.465505_7_plen_77_part_00